MHRISIIYVQKSKLKLVKKIEDKKFKSNIL